MNPRNGPARRAMSRGCVLAAALSFPAITHAQAETELAIRRQLLDDATEAARSGDPSRALDLAQRAGRIRMTPSVRAFIATQSIATHAYVEASAAADHCLADLRRDAANPQREQLMAECTGLAQRANESVGRISIDHVDTSLPGLVVRVGSAPLNVAFLGVAVIANPGPTLVEVSANGYETFRRQVTVTAQQVTRVPVELHLTAIHAGADAPRQDTVTAIVPDRSALAPRPDVVARPSRTGPVVTMVIGGAALVTGGVFFGLQASAFGDCRQTSAGNVCDGATPESSGRTAVTFNRVAITGTIAGSALLVGGVLWWFLTPARSHEAAPRAWIAPSFTPDATGFVAGGSL